MADGRISSPSAGRHEWVDAARGLGILLVVYGHALRGQIAASGGAAPPWAAAQDAIIYGFHMPLFFLLAGLFLERSLVRGRRRFLADKLVTVVYPYFLWSVAMGLVELLADRLVNSPVGMRDLLLIPIRPIEQFWFLYCLFLCQLAVFLMLPRRLALVALAIAGAWVAQGLAGNIFGMALANLPYVVAGVCAAAQLLRLAGQPRVMLLAVAAAAFAAFALGLSPPASPPLRYATALAGSAGTIALAMALARNGGAGLLRSLGEASLAIYVMHTMVSAGARIVLGALGARLPLGVAISICTVAGVVLPWIAWRIACRHGLSLALGFGRAPPGAVVGKAGAA